MPHFPQVGGIFLVHNLHKGRRATMATDAIAATIAAFTTAMAAEYSLPVLPRCSRPHHFGRLAAILLIFGPRCTRPDLKASLQPSSFWCLAAVVHIISAASLPTSSFWGFAALVRIYTEEKARNSVRWKEEILQLQKSLPSPDSCTDRSTFAPVPPDIQCWGVCASTPPHERNKYCNSTLDFGGEGGQARMCSMHVLLHGWLSV